MKKVVIYTDKIEYFNLIINSDDLPEIDIRPASAYNYKINEEAFFYISCYDENFSYFSMEKICPLMVDDYVREEKYNNKNYKVGSVFRIRGNIRQAIKQKKMKVLLFHGLEGYHSVNFNHILKLLDIPASQLLYITGDYRFSKLTKDPKTGVNIIYSNYWERNASTVADMNSDIYTKQLSILKSGKKRNYFNTCYNRRIRDHRILLMSVLKYEKLLDKMIWSWGGDVENTLKQQFAGDMSFINHVYINRLGNEYADSVLEVFNWGSKQNGKPAVEDLNINLVNTINEEHIFDTYIQFICETWATNKSTFLSEKSFKPFALGQPFLSWSDKGTVAALRDMGYDVFDDIFSHDYDSIEDDIIRLKTVVGQVKLFVRGNYSELSKAFEKDSFIKRIEHNKNNLRNSFKRNGLSVELMRGLR